MVLINVRVNLLFIIQCFLYDINLKSGSLSSTDTDTAKFKPVLKNGGADRQINIYSKSKRSADTLSC